LDLYGIIKTTFKMKKIFISLIIIYLNLCQLSFGQIKSMGFTQPIADMPDEIYRHDFKGKMKLERDILYVCSYTGIYKKNLRDDTDWELYAFENVPVREFVRNGDKLLAISSAKAGSYSSYEKADSLLLLSNDNGQTFTDFTSPYFFQDAELNMLYRMAQNPENPNSILVLQAIMGISKSDDFGATWKPLTNYRLGHQDWELVFHPLDTTLFFYSGEIMAFQGHIHKFSDNGAGDFSRQVYEHPGGDNCVHSLAFHPANPDILVYGAELACGKSTDRGNTWNVKDLYSGGMYFYKVLFDEENPDILYASGRDNRIGAARDDTIFVYRSTDMGDSWQLFYSGYVGEARGYVRDMVKYKNKLIFYTRDWELFELDLENTSN
jgi:hypothetical protein